MSKFNDDDDIFMLEALEEAEAFESRSLQTSFTAQNSESYTSLGRGKMDLASFSLVSNSYSTSNLNTELINLSSPLHSEKCKKLSKDILGDFVTVHVEEKYKNSGKKECMKHENMAVRVPDRCKDVHFSKIMNTSRLVPHNSIVRKRKFPGPAGLLPKWNKEATVKADVFKDDTLKYESNYEDFSICSQATAKEFVSGIWKQMIMDLCSVTNKSKQELLQFNIKWILQRAYLKGSASIRKISFIPVSVKSVDLSYYDATAVFQDESGEMHGIISKNVLDEYSDCIISGSVLVLRDLTVLSPGSHQAGAGLKNYLKRHYLNVTSNTLVAIYSTDENENGQAKKTLIVQVTKDLISSLIKNQQQYLKITETEDGGETLAGNVLFETTNGSDNLRNSSTVQNIKQNIHNIEIPETGFLSETLLNPLLINTATRSPVANLVSATKSVERVLGSSSEESHNPRFPAFSQSHGLKHFEGNFLQRPSSDDAVLKDSVQPSGKFALKFSNFININSVNSCQNYLDAEDEMDCILASINTDSM